MSTTTRKAPRMRLTFAVATEADAAELTALRVATGERLTATFGRGYWSGELTERGVLSSIRAGRVLLARRGKNLAGTLGRTGALVRRSLVHCAL